jgi:hypothetical protein
LTIYGLGSHSGLGLGEEWADNENAGTSAEAQAFKRACSCFGLGRYLYDLGGNWVDLDDRKQPLSRPRLPDWAVPERKPGATTSQNGNAHTGTNGHMQHKSAAVDLPTLKVRVKMLCEQVGFGLARSVTKAIAATEDPEHVSNVTLLCTLAAKLEDTLRGVERLRTATEIVGQASFSQLCQQMNLAGDCLDDIPDRRALRRSFRIGCSCDHSSSSLRKHQYQGASRRDWLLTRSKWQNCTLPLFAIRLRWWRRCEGKPISNCLRIGQRPNGRNSLSSSRCRAKVIWDRGSTAPWTGR